jgi:hypothetical protein
MRSFGRLSALAIGLIPAIETGLLVWLVLEASFARSVPSWTDEIQFWNEINSFRVVGFDSGYHVLNEQPAAAAFSHFGPHGPLFPSLLGSIARVSGWTTASGPIFNVAFICLGMAGYIVLIRPDRRQQLTLAVALATFWPILLYIPVTMEETLQQGLACLLAGLLALRMAARRQPAWPTTIAWNMVLGLAAVLRPSWSLVWLAMAISTKVSLARLVSAFAAMAGVFAIFRWMSSPYPSFFNDLIQKSRDTPSLGISILGDHVGRNLSFLIKPSGEPLERLLIWQVAGLTIWSVVLWLRQDNKADIGVRSPVFHALNLGGALLLTILLYDLGEWRGYRVLAGPLLLSCLVWIGLHQLRPVALIIASNLAFSGSFLGTYYTSNYSRFHMDPARIQAPASALAAAIHWQPGLSPWCNTVLWLAEESQVEQLGLPAGMGLTTTVGEQQLFHVPFRSRYVFLANTVRLHPSLMKPLVPLTSIRLGTLYENVDSPYCQHLIDKAPRTR